MPTYLLSFRVPDEYRSTEDMHAAWRAFFAGISPHLEEIGNPIFRRRSVGETGAGTALGGYSLIHADSLEQAEALAARCPLIGRGGGVEVGELTPLADPRPAQPAASRGLEG